MVAGDLLFSNVHRYYFRFVSQYAIIHIYVRASNDKQAIFPGSAQAVVDPDISTVSRSSIMTGGIYLLQQNDQLVEMREHS